jgi:putative peptidoglycan lipid II flippase
VLTQIYFARQEPRYPLMAGLLSLFCALLIGRALAPSMPATGAAAAASMAFLIQCLTLSLLLIRHGLWSPGRALASIVARLLIASAAMAFALWGASGLLWHFLIAHPSTLAGIAALTAICAAGMAVFALTAWLLGVVTRSDIARMQGR